MQKQSRALGKRHRFFTNPKNIICQLTLAWHHCLQREDDECTVRISFGNSYKSCQGRNTARHEVGKLQKNSKKILTKSRFLHNWAEFQKKIDPIQNCISERSTFVDLTLLCMFLWSGMIIRSRAWKSCSEKFCFQKKVSKKNSYSEENPFWKVLLEAIGSFFITYLQPHYGNEFFGNVYLSAGQH